MKRVLISIIVVALAGVCLADEQKIKLDYCTDKAIAKIVGSHRWVNCGSDIEVCGKVFRIQTKSEKGMFSLGIDMNDDGKISSVETVQFPPKRFRPYLAVFKVKVAGERRDVPVYIYNGWTKGGKVHLQYRAAWAMSAEINGQKIYFITNPHNGKICVGNAYYATKSMTNAIPLRPNICVNGKYYNVSFNDNGTDVTLNEIPQSDGFGKFSFKSKSKMKSCKRLVLINDDWAFDLMDSALKTVPAKTFEIESCVFDAKRSKLTSVRLEDQLNPEITFKAHNENIINIGFPFTYYFEATLEDGSVNIPPSNMLMGSGGIVYRYEGPKTNVRPMVRIYQGKRCVSKGRIPFGSDGKLFRFSRKVSGLSQKSGSVAVMRLFPGVGKLKGEVEFADGKYPQRPPKEDIVSYKQLKI